MKKFTALKFAGLIVAGIGMIIANEVQKREINDAVEKALAERDEARALPESPLASEASDWSN